MNPEITLKIKPVNNITELQDLEGGKYVRKIGMVYFQQMPENKYIIRVVTTHTNGEWLLSQVKKKLIYVPEEEIKAQVI